MNDIIFFKDTYLHVTQRYESGVYTPTENTLKNAVFSSIADAIGDNFRKHWVMFSGRNFVDDCPLS